jgi:iron complex transport system substrate-binding protein
MRSNRANLLLLLAALAACALAASGARARAAAAVPTASAAGFQRIASCESLGDALLAELCESDRIIATSRYRMADAWRLPRALPRLDMLSDVEGIIALRPDLLVTASGEIGDDAGRIAKLRSAGIAVFDLGPAGGVDSWADDAVRLAELLGDRRRGERFIARLRRDLAAVAADLSPERPRRRAIALSVYADRIYGYTTGSSTHDALVAAGCHDVLAACASEPWPAVAAETLIALAPDLIITSTAGAAALRAHPAFAGVPALGRADGVLALDDDMLTSPGPGLLDIAERIRAFAYPR